VQKTINSIGPNALSVDNVIKRNDIREIKLAMAQLSFIAHAYIWGGRKPEKVLPEVISKPWV
jgi:indoleamine 2,3-dioxygenase